MRHAEENLTNKEDDKSVKKIKFRHADHNNGDLDPFLRYWLHDLPASLRDMSRPGYFART